MSDYRLTSKAEASLVLSGHFQNSAAPYSVLSVREDKCFRADGWLDLGEVVLRPGYCEPGEEEVDKLATAVDLGFFEWKCKKGDEILAQAADLMQLEKDEQKDRTGRALDSVACVAARAGLIHPLFDADAISQMPFRRPTTVVPDTSAVLQGGLDFVVRFLYPMARVKVPAIAHMEILNAADNYFKLRRAAKLKDKAKALFEHVVSQGGQRALLRLELQTDAEIERGRLGADPLRGVVHKDADAEDKSLGLQEVQRSFADRLIFETARQHLSQSSPDHPVMLMTADQGLARMTLGEGMQPLFFETTRLEAISGRTLSGTTFDPFTGTLYPVSLTDLLWEFAVTFGMARLRCASCDAMVEVCAIGDTLSWKPYHAKDDLLWLRHSAPTKATAVQVAIPRVADGLPSDAEIPKPVQPASEVIPPSVPGAAPAKSYTGSYKFSLPKMLTFISRLSSSTGLTLPEVLGTLEIKSPTQFEDYRNFLLAGGFLETTVEIRGTAFLGELAVALKDCDLRRATTLFRRVPSFSAYVDYLFGSRNDNPVAQRAIPTYTSLAESLGLAFEIPDDRVYGTPNCPTPEDFADIALAVYQDLGGHLEQYVMTGLWLEGLVRRGIHPLTSRRLLEEARERGLLERYTEGSTPETRYQNHTFYVIEVRGGLPVVRKVGIFEGDFLIPGKSSVSIRLRRVQA